MENHTITLQLAEPKENTEVRKHRHSSGSSAVSEVVRAHTHTARVRLVGFGGGESTLATRGTQGPAPNPFPEDGLVWPPAALVTSSPGHQLSAGRVSHL